MYAKNECCNMLVRDCPSTRRDGQDFAERTLLILCQIQVYVSCLRLGLYCIRKLTAGFYGHFWIISSIGIYSLFFFPLQVLI